MRRDDRNLVRGELGDERVLFVRSAHRSIALDDRTSRPPAAPSSTPDLIDAVLVAVEREQAAVAVDADRVERVEDAIGRQRGVGMRSIVHRAILGLASDQACGTLPTGV